MVNHDQCFKKICYQGQPWITKFAEALGHLNESNSNLMLIFHYLFIYTTDSVALKELFENTGFLQKITVVKTWRQSSSLIPGKHVDVLA